MVCLPFPNGCFILFLPTLHQIYTYTVCVYIYIYIYTQKKANAVRMFHINTQNDQFSVAPSVSRESIPLDFRVVFSNMSNSYEKTSEQENWSGDSIYSSQDTLEEGLLIFPIKALRSKSVSLNESSQFFAPLCFSSQPSQVGEFHHAKISPKDWHSSLSQCRFGHVEPPKTRSIHWLEPHFPFQIAVFMG